MQKASGFFLDGVQALCWVVDGLREQGVSLQVINNINDAYRNLMDATLETEDIIRAIGYLTTSTTLLIILLFSYFLFCLSQS